MSGRRPSSCKGFGSSRLAAADRRSRTGPSTCNDLVSREPARRVSHYTSQSPPGGITLLPVPTRPDPFAVQTVPEVPLARAPLVRVIAQLRFPVVAALAKLDAVGPFQEAIRDRYPILRSEQPTAFVVGPQGIQIQAGAGNIWRFHDKNDKWRVSLTTEFVALESFGYVSRDDFVSRLQEVLNSLDKCVKPAVYDRLGIRYVNRLSGPALDDLARLVQPEVLGVGATKFSANLVHTMCESSFRLNSDRLNARWGLLPPGATVDPGAIEPLKELSWILDMDAFTTTQEDFSVDAVTARARSFSSRIYALFRWAVTDEFLARFGART